MVQKAKIVVFSVLLVLLFVIVLLVPIFPVKSVVVHTRTRLLLFHVETSDNSAAEVTNKDSVGANFTVELRLSEMKPVVGGVEFDGVVSTTICRFIDAGATERFNCPAEWSSLESKYTLFCYVNSINITVPNYNETVIEHKSLISIINGK